MCYSLVGQNVFTSFSFIKGGLVQLSPMPPSNFIITARSGDVVGYYSNNRNGGNGGVQVDSSYNQNVIWFKEVGAGQVADDGCLVLDHPMTSINAAPMLKISTSECMHNFFF